MMIPMLRAKLHRITVTGANLDYEGSIVVDEDMLDAVGLRHYDKVLVGNNNNGNRWETYVVPGKRGSGCCELNGAGARLALPGDRLIIMAYADFTEDERQSWKPRVAVLDHRNGRNFVTAR